MAALDVATARAIAQRLLSDGMPEHGTPDAVAAGAEYVLAHVFRSLAQWIGVAGCHALFARAIALSAPQHPVLTGVRHRQHGPPHLDRLGENAHEYGSQATAEGATTILATIITTLAGLIGEDIAMSLLEQVPPCSPNIPHPVAPDSVSDLAPDSEPNLVTELIPRIGDGAPAS